MEVTLIDFRRGISIPAPTKGATHTSDSTQVIDFDFNPRTHEGCDSSSFYEGGKTAYFNPRTHEGCDKTKLIVQHPAPISIPAPTKGATLYGGTGNLRRQNFNPRTHEGCDVTNAMRIRHGDDFNPRTHEGCDKALAGEFPGPCDFNPRTHEGCDMDAVIAMENHYISIPAPTKGATPHDYVPNALQMISIPAPTKGATGYFPSEQCGDTRFQSPHPRRVRLAANAAGARGRQFQSPHPRRVRRYKVFPNKNVEIISIPAPTKGATCAFEDIGFRIVISIPAPTKGATICGCDGSFAGLDFNPRTHEGCD